MIHFSLILIRQEDSRRDYPPVWSHLGLNQGPPDYESGATNQLSYGTSSRVTRDDISMSCYGSCVR